eukprot:scaffold92761_cov33-Attheya_sp.AAC.1
MKTLVFDFGVAGSTEDNKVPKEWLHPYTLILPTTSLLPNVWLVMYTPPQSLMPKMMVLPKPSPLLGCLVLPKTCCRRSGCFCRVCCGRNC